MNERKIRRQNFFNEIVTLKYCLLGAFRNIYGELFVLFKKINDNKSSVEDSLFITGDEFDWEIQEITPKLDFIFSRVEFEKMISILPEEDALNDCWVRQ